MQTDFTDTKQKTEWMEFWKSIEKENKERNQKLDRNKLYGKQYAIFIAFFMYNRAKPILWLANQSDTRRKEKKTNHDIHQFLSDKKNTDEKNSFSYIFFIIFFSKFLYAVHFCNLVK